MAPRRNLPCKCIRGAIRMSENATNMMPRPETSFEERQAITVIMRALDSPVTRLIDLQWDAALETGIELQLCERLETGAIRLTAKGRKLWSAHCCEVLEARRIAEGLPPLEPTGPIRVPPEGMKRPPQ